MTIDDVNKIFQYAILKMYEGVIEIKCSHDWKEYIGFTERYNYCTKCDTKENHYITFMLLAIAFGVLFT